MRQILMAVDVSDSQLNNLRQPARKRLHGVDPADGAVAWIHVPSIGACAVESVVKLAVAQHGLRELHDRLADLIRRGLLLGAGVEKRFELCLCFGAPHRGERILVQKFQRGASTLAGGRLQKQVALLVEKRALCALLRLRDAARELCCIRKGI